MALATQRKRSLDASASVASLKSFAQTRDSQAANGTPERGAGLRVKFNPDWSKAPDGSQMTTATVEVDATNIILRINGSIERNVAWAGLKVAELIRAINVPAANGDRYWRAGLGDVDPDTGLSLAVLAETDCALGYLDSIPIGESAAFFLYVAQGFDESERGSGDFVPIMFNTDYTYNKDPAGTPGDVGRGGGIDASQGEDFLPQRASRFGTSKVIRPREVNPARPLFETLVNRISHNLVAGGEEIIFQIFELQSFTPIWGIEVPDTQNEIVVPDVRTSGPAFMTVNAKAFGSFTAGKATMRGYSRMA